MILRTDYAAHEMLVAPARPTRAIWRFAVGMAVAILGYIAFGQMFFQLVFGLTLNTDPGFVDRVFEGQTPLTLLILLATFGFMTMSVAVMVRLIHRRGILSLVGHLPLAMRQFAGVFVALAVVGVVLFVLPPWDMGGDFVPNMAIGLWVMLLPVSLLAIFVQVSAEELFFRGYMQQQLAARFRSPLIWMLLPSAFFALGHYQPEEGHDMALMIALWAGVFGLLSADLTARAGTLGPAIALHLYNNVNAVLIVSLPGDLSGLALFHAPFGMDDTEQIRAWLPVDFALMLVGWLTARLALRR